MLSERRGLLIILSSPSGAGKSTLARALRDWDPNMDFSISATTRPRRAGEEDGREYHFVDQASFQRLIDEDQMLEHARVFDHSYGSPRGPVEKAVSEGRDVIFDIDWQGGTQIRNSVLGNDVVSIFVLPPSIADLELRLRARAQDSDAVIQDRMAKSRDEISHWSEYDYCLINDDLEQTKADLKTILTAERLKRVRQPGLVEFVRGLDREFEERPA
ncbi:MAG: guanylate kinase [Pseudomonadota bacterium]